MSNLPLPPQLPTLRPLGFAAQFRGDPLGLFLRAQAEKGDLVRLRMAHRTLIFAYRPEHVQRVLIDEAEHYSKQSLGFQVLRQVLRDGLLVSEGELWRRQRRVANPAFQQKRIAAFARAMLADTDRMLAGWSLGQEVDITEELMRLTLRVVGTSLFGVDASRFSADIDEALLSVLHTFRLMASNPLLLFLPNPTRAAQKRATAVLDRVVHGIIAERRAAPPRDDLLGMLMAARDEETGQGMSDELLRDEVLSMLVAGHETTANALSWTLYELSRHPELLRAATMEATSALTAPLSEDAPFPAMPLVDRCVKEAMRLWPPVWAQARRCESDRELDGFRIPEGATVFLSVHAMQRHPSYWEEPERYDPDRWLPERAITPSGEPRHRLTWIPFGAGQRKCIGEHFALLECRVVLGRLLSRHSLAVKPGHIVEPEPAVSLRPRGGLPMIVQPPVC